MDSLADGPNGVATVAHISRTLETRVEGQLAMGWRTVALGGSGRGRQTLALDGVTGMLSTLDGSSELMLDVRDSARPDDSQLRLTQRVTLTARRIP